jgi:hypothetical protein
MNISIKTKASIHAQLEKIRNDSFKEDDIKLLLIDIREDIREESLLREFADFIAHPKRDKGIFNKALNIRYLKFKLLDEQIEKLNEEQQKKIKTNRQYSDFMLSAINIEKVEKKIFEILFIDGLADIDDKLFTMHYPISKKKVKKLISDNYQLDTGKKYYHLKSRKDFARVEDALKFIIGTIHAKPIFNQATFEKEILKAVTRTINDLNLDKTYLASVKKHSKSILLCILCLLHDAKFIFHDKHIATCFLSLYPQGKKSISEPVTKESFIALVSADTRVTMPIFVSNIKIGDHLLLDKTEISKVQHMERIPWINTTRNTENKLLLTDKEKLT